MPKCLRLTSRSSNFWVYIFIFPGYLRFDSVGKNRPLKRVPINWRSSFPITSSQIQRKRDEFWYTAPAFEGRIEIWNALKLATEFFEKQDYDMVQAILDGAGIILPSGTLCDCYDELGARYQLPLYVLNYPINLCAERSNSDNQSIGSQNMITTVSRNQNSNQLPNTIRQQSQISACQEYDRQNRNLPNGNLCGCWSFFNIICHCGRRQTQSTNWNIWNSCHFDSTNSTDQNYNNSDCEKSETMKHISNNTNSINPLCIRLSTGEDYKLEITNNNITILEAKNMVKKLTGWNENRQRWFVCGHLLTNQTRLIDYHIPSGFIIQVIVHSPFDPEINWRKKN